MIKFLSISLLFFMSHLHGFEDNEILYDEDEIICIATYELAKNFFQDMKDEKTSLDMETRKKDLLDKYEEGHFPQEDIEFMITEIHYAWSNDFDFLLPILENCVQNVN